MTVKAKFKSGFHFSYSATEVKYDPYRDKCHILIENEILKSMGMGYLVNKNSDKKHSILTLNTTELKSLKFGEDEVLEKNIIKRYFMNVSRNTGTMEMCGAKISIFRKALLGFYRNREI